jgi:uroporphyrin-III C-methyltransferase
MKGKVYLVGAGPGDPELLTLKAARLLRGAHAVLHDDLVPPEILKMISPAAMVTNVGKRCGRKSIRQEEINFLMITLASANLQVVRLKSGDPLIFGRGGEEIEALRAAEIEYEIVPGITSALGAAASAKIPLTDRRASSAVIFLTAHVAGHKDQADWSPLAGSRATIVVYMPGRNYAEIRRGLTSAGLSPDTPCAIVSRATTAEQQVYRTTIQELDYTPSLPPPALLVVGQVVRLGTAPAEILGSDWERMLDHVPEPKLQAEAAVG